MDKIQRNIYECENPECGLRFPEYEGGPKWNRCPKCRSVLRLAAKVEDIVEPQHRMNVNKRNKFVALLDNIRSAWNVGSIFRTADGFGIEKIYLCGISPTPENIKVAKTALGAEYSVAWKYFPNGVKLAQELKAQGYLLYALEDLPGSTSLFEIGISPFTAPVGLIVGNEVCGVDPGIISQCDQVISIPMQGKKQSFNVAIAFGIASSYLSYRIGTITST